MKLLIDFFPIALFFIAYKVADIYTATGVLMAATVLQMLLVRHMDGKLQTMHKITLVLVLGFGALTLGLHDERFIKWKPTLLYAGLAIGLGVAHGVFRKNALQLLLAQQLKLPPAVWHRLNVSWVLYCAFMATLNGYVAARFSTDAWMNFKIWGYIFPL
ncbi:MAG: septation protein A, partial [Limnohabitans sp.]